jgi:hypothetical protein
VPEDFCKCRNTSAPCRRLSASAETHRIGAGGLLQLRKQIGFVPKAFCRCRKGGGFWGKFRFGLRMVQIKLYKTPWKALKLILLTMPFVAGGVWMISDKPENIWGWMAVCFFGFGIPIGLFHIFDRRPQIIIDEEGIWDRTIKQDKINWRQIHGAYPIDINGQHFVSLILDDTFIFKKNVYKWALKINEIVGGTKAKSISRSIKN